MARQKKTGASKKKNEASGKRILRSRFWFDNPGRSGRDRALFRALPQFRLHQGRRSRPAGRSSASRSPAPTSRPATATTCSLPQRVRDGIRDAGGIALEFPMHPIQETGKRPTAALDRNLAYLGLVEVLYGYPLDGVVLTTGCDKTTPAAIMAAATVNIPAIVLSGGPMLNGWWKGERAGSGTIKWATGKRLAAGEIDYDEYHGLGRGRRALDRPLQHHGHRLDHERARRGARPVAARLRRDPGALSRARPDGLRDRPARGRDRARGPQALRHPHPRGVRERHRGLHRRSAARPMRRSISTRSRATPASRCRSRTGRRSATTCRCWSTCSRPENISARNITAPAGCRRCSASCIKAKRLHADALDHQRQDHRRERARRQDRRMPT